MSVGKPGKTLEGESRHAYNHACVVALDQRQIDFFQRHRYLKLPGFLAGDEVDALLQWCQQVTDWPEEPGRHMVYYEDDLRQPGQRVLSRVENFIPYHEELGALLNGPRCLEPAAKLMGEPVLLFKDKINYKLPGGDGFRWHQDVQAGWDRYGSIHLTLMISIDDTTEANGCLQLAHGFEGGLIGEMSKPLEMEALEGMEICPCPTVRGDAVFFDSYLPHGSEVNQTEDARRVLYVTYGLAADGDQRQLYYHDKRLSYPPDCEREKGREYVFKV